MTGESTWNEIFNKGKGAQRWLGMPFRFARGLFAEAFLATTPTVERAQSPSFLFPCWERPTPPLVSLRMRLFGLSLNQTVACDRRGPFIP
jgi:hypothetical protein